MLLGTLGCVCGFGARRAHGHGVRRRAGSRRTALGSSKEGTRDSRKFEGRRRCRWSECGEERGIEGRLVVMV
ncbi:hypothetical protein FA95DRAFT_697251 [Auriscalpium vulgare]|uniref:Uncharacterized protein n=1 Tax=Auriscalpium vulgare TaxID=40419 RepID=A0ACB8RBF3_9AGAM|nr:hypothetical protein FA95DRAFT_697251 [Auriscalpium vulgare]